MNRGGVIALGVLMLLAAAVVPATAEDIGGVIAKTITLTEDSRLVADVVCTVTGGPCIRFGAPNIVLSLNGFTITGNADPITGCKGTLVATDVGIHTNSQNNVGVRGPGIVQRFQADGILFATSVKGWVQGVTAATNCMSGIRVNPTSSQISVESNLAMRNGAANNPCGGI